ncbi:DNA repair protein RecN [Prochlorococcus sp. MIT 0603]|nr:MULTISPECIES: AAA family ATPase [unclassified Prochlorococcus]KGG14500.1 DNA repair protein RecN [Prochlorococcus sp. MIT 0602]KGG16075.1 DNA repair protein RecN [Prochlorococcus sp. MIT 0603]
MESLDLRFEKGFSVFTGETGAGKSVFLLAIDSLLGGSSVPSSRLMRAGSKECLIEACFSIDSNVENWLKENSFDHFESELFISRDWKIKDDRLSSRIRLNGEIINRKQLLSLRPSLIDLTEQGKFHLLTSSLEQLRMLDRLGSDVIKKAKLSVKENWNSWKLAESKLIDLKKEKESFDSRFLIAKTFLEDLDSLQIEDPDEENTLKKEQDRILHSVKIHESLGLLFSRLNENNQDLPTALDHFSVCIQEMKSLLKLDSSLIKNFETLVESNYKLEEFLSSLSDYKYQLDNESNELENIQSRLSDINNLKKRYQLDFSGLFLKKQKSKAVLNIQDYNDSLNLLESQEKSLRLKFNQSTLELTILRKRYAQQLEESLVQHLYPLGLENIIFKIDFSNILPSQIGVDRIEFMFSSNPGQPLAPLSQIASGGELSRFSLALATVFSDISPSTTLLFDEIDSGVSGRISTAIAKLLKDLSLNKQIFCITHQPLVAALADHHFSVSKSINNGTTNSKVLLLKEFGDRQAALATLAGGNFTEASVYAASLLDNKAA